MAITVIKDSISRADLAHIAKELFGDMVKAVVDIENEIMAIGGELHADEEAMLLEQGSMQKNLWGINLYPQMSSDEWIEFDSMINIRPTEGNRSRNVENPDVQAKIRTIITKLVID